jgi:hypothetical protein
VLKRFVPVLVACLSAGCGNESAPLAPLRALPHAVATNSCGPADGPLVVVYLASMPIESLQPVAPFVQVHIPKSFAELGAGSVFPISESFTDANAWFHGSGVERTANGGEIGVTSTSATAMAGYVDLRFPDGVRLRGTFTANFQPRLMLCG